MIVWIAGLIAVFLLTRSDGFTISKSGFQRGYHRPLPIRRLASPIADITSIGKAIDVIDRIPSRKISALQLSVLTGDTVRDAHKRLQSLAHEGQGSLEVTETGDVLYSFPSNLRSQLARSSKKRMIQMWLHHNRVKLKELSRQAVSVTAYALTAALTVAVVLLVAVGAGTTKKDREKEKKPSRDYHYHHHHYYYGPRFYSTPVNMMNYDSLNSGLKDLIRWLCDLWNGLWNGVINFVFGPDPGNQGNVFIF